jgi:hypothetical protein
MDLADRDGVEVMELLPAVATGHHEAGALQDAEVLHHSEARQVRKAGAQLTDGLTVRGEQRVEHRAPRRLGQRPEHRVACRVANHPVHHVTFGSHVKRGR